VRARSGTTRREPLAGGTWKDTLLGTLGSLPFGELGKGNPLEKRTKRKVAKQARRRVSNRVTSTARLATAAAPPYVLPHLREWDRATDLLKTFAISGFITERSVQGALLPVRPASVLLVGNPGSGKTEIIERFKRNPWLSYHNDLTVKSLVPILRRAEAGKVTHVAAPEFNKWFQRKSAIAENCIGLLSSAMEEGIVTYSVGPQPVTFENARLGLFGGMTPGSLARRKMMLDEMGFTSRANVVEWSLPKDELKEILRRMNVGILTDLEPVDLVLPEAGRAIIRWDEKIGEQIQAFVTANWPRNLLRTFKRFKTIGLAQAYLMGRDAVTDDVWRWLRSYDDWWNRMVVGE
jgi:hypothetical protein